MSEGDDLVGDIQRFNQIYFDLLNMNVKIKEDVRVLLLLCSLPSVYDGLITTLVYGKESLEYEEVVGALRSNIHWEKICKEDSTSEAFAIHEKQGRSGKREKAWDRSKKMPMEPHRWVEYVPETWMPVEAQMSVVPAKSKPMRWWMEYALIAA
uniref:Uncharacterized protein LOC109506019 n=1 Tax=Elaeis guineensis var. tenera TaxID=51953 RepID=A0A6J0PK08_ELAGV|nr:uncharacterized protein LOC109506019 [Elaeis guineensis]